MGGSRSRSRERRGRSRSRSPSRRSSSKERSKKERLEKRRSRSRSRQRDRKSRSRDRDRDRYRSRSRSRSRRRDKDRKRDDEKDRKRDDEREARRAAKKQKRADDLADMMGYTETNNPYGDSNLGAKFVWHKKRAGEEDRGLTEDDAARRDQSRREETMRELAKLKERREERELEREAMEAERTRQQRDMERMSYGDLDRKEELFHLQQAKLRAEIRVREGRPKPIDILALCMNLDNLDVDVNLEDPSHIFLGLTLPETEALRKDLEGYHDLERHTDNGEFWRLMLVVCDSHLEKLREDPSRSQPGISEEVAAELERSLAAKSVDELVELEQLVRGKLDSDEPIDEEYWMALYKRATVHLAMARLRVLLAKTLKTRLALMKEEQARRAEAGEPELPTTRVSASQAAAAHAAAAAEDEQRRQQDDSAYDNSADAARLQAKEAANYSAEENSEVFSTEIHLGAQVYKWQDKFRPRKPRYFNRVYTGYEWNKYNQMHYDHDNPPPKTVQGYKFNIFYPDLINKQDTPTYKIIPDPESADKSTCFIRFSAGPPYEDIAFRIIAREWEQSQKHGFRSSFDRGVLQLHFHFKRYRYRK